MSKKMMKGWIALSILAVAVYMAPSVHGETITGNQIRVKANDVITTYDLDQVKTEVEDGKTKVCICRCLCFRALQLLAAQFSDGVVPRDDINIFTGWTTRGAEELFVDAMGWSPSDLAFVTGAKGPYYLTIGDAVFFFVQKSTGMVWKVKANETLYPKEFFTYRTLVKTGEATDEQKSFFQSALRPQAVVNLEFLPSIDKFSARAIPYLDENGILHIPDAFVSDGSAYGAELEDEGDGTFLLRQVTPIHGE